MEGTGEGGGFGVFAADGAVVDRRPGRPVCADLGLGVVVGTPISSVVPHHHLVHMIHPAQVDLHVSQPRRAGGGEFAAGGAAVVGPQVAVRYRQGLAQGDAAGGGDCGTRQAVFIVVRWQAFMQGTK